MNTKLILIIFTATFAACGGQQSQPTTEERGAPTPTPESRVGFQERLDAGAPCSELFEIRNALDSKSPLLPGINERLRGIGCFTASSTRVPTGELSRRGDFTVREYRIYRNVIDTPTSVGEKQALEAASRKFGIEVSEVKGIVEKVLKEISKENWFGTADSEVRHASDWKP